MVLRGLNHTSGQSKAVKPKVVTTGDQDWANELNIFFNRIVSRIQITILLAKGNAETRPLFSIGPHQLPCFFTRLLLPPASANMQYLNYCLFYRLFILHLSEPLHRYINQSSVFFLIYWKKPFSLVVIKTRNSTFTIFKWIKHNLKCKTCYWLLGSREMTEAFIRMRAENAYLFTGVKHSARLGWR